MNVKQAVDDVLEKPMDRKEFLVNTGVALLSLAGVSALLRAFGSHDRQGPGGYGSGGYGR